MVKYVSAAWASQSLEKQQVLRTFRAFRFRSLPLCRSTNAVFTFPLTFDSSSAAASNSAVPKITRKSTLTTRPRSRLLWTVAYTRPSGATRYGFRGRAATNVLIFLPLSTPEIVLGASLLTLFLNFNVVFGFGTILIAHIMFCISFAVVTVKARLVGFDRHLEEAAMDLGANEWVTFRKVTLPLIAPAILAALLLCFAISIDDFVVTYFNAGSETTFPLFVWGAARVGAPPQVNVIGTAIFVIAVSGMLVNVLIQMRRTRAATS